MLLNKIRDPFSASPTADFSTAEEERFIDPGCSLSLRPGLHFGLESERTIAWTSELVAFATSYLCERGLSAVASIKTIYRAKVDIKNELRVVVSQLLPHFDRICST